MTGIRIATAEDVDRLPSAHFAATLCVAPGNLWDLTAGLIDGVSVRPDGSTLDIVPLSECPDYAQVAVLDLAPSHELCFVVDLWSRRGIDLDDGDWDTRGRPALLQDCVVDGRWGLFNCVLTLRPWTRSLLDQGKLPG